MLDTPEVPPTIPPLMEQFMARRQQAAALWGTIPTEKVNMAEWQNCALGHLARQTEGWEIREFPNNSDGGKFVPVLSAIAAEVPSDIFFWPITKHPALVSAQNYFGLPLSAALNIFRGNSDFATIPQRLLNAPFELAEAA